MARWKARATALLEACPIAASLNIHFTGKEDARRAVLEIELRDLVTGAVVGTTRLKPKPPPRADPRGSRTRPTVLLEAAGSRLVVSYGKELFLLQVKEASASRLPVPLQFAIPEAPPIASVDEPAKIAFEGRGGTPLYRLSVVNESRHVHADERGNELLVDTPALWNEFLERKKGYLFRSSDEPELTRFLRENPSRFEQFTGRQLAPGKAAFSVHVTLLLTDAKAKQARLDTVVLVVTPLEPLVDLLFDTSRLDPELARHLGTRHMGEPKGPSTDPLALVEERIDRIEDALPALLEKLERLEKALGISPPPGKKRR